MKRLVPAQAAKYLAPFADDFARKGSRIGMDADREVLIYGGAMLFEVARCDFAELADARGATFIDGDLVVDGWVENDGGVVFVRGNLITHSLYNSGYLVVLGDLHVQRLLGHDERYGTLVFGDAKVDTVVLSRNHHFDVWGSATIGEEASSDADQLDDVREDLRQWAKQQGRLPDELANLRFTPRRRPPPPRPNAPAAPTRASTPAAADPAPAEAPPPRPPSDAPRSEVVVELEKWLDETKLSQREQVAALRKDWIGRLGPADRDEAKRLIKRAINSKKLVAERDELLSALG